MNSYQSRRDYSDKFLPQVQAMLGQRFFMTSNVSQDTKQGIDLWIPSLTFAVRIRDLKYAPYKDFTVRTSSFGYPSEYAKLLSSSGPDFIFYGFADTEHIKVAYLIPRLAWRSHLLEGKLKPIFRRNSDNSHFATFPLLSSYTEQIL